jgi:precorrin-2 dehydrogenase/sirohydrochlorin ferrochelatase
MARELRKRLSKAITTEDILQIKLQEYIRDILKKENLNQKERRKILYEIFNNENIKKLIEEEKLKEAKKYIDDNLHSMIYS